MRLAGRLLSNLNLDNDRFSRATVQAATVWITSKVRNLAAESNHEICFSDQGDAGASIAELERLEIADECGRD